MICGDTALEHMIDDLASSHRRGATKVSELPSWEYLA